MFSNYSQYGNCPPGGQLRGYGHMQTTIEPLGEPRFHSYGNLWDDIKYDAGLAAYKLGLKSVPPIVMPVDVTPEQVAADPALAAKIQKRKEEVKAAVEKLPSKSDVILGGFKDAGKSLLPYAMPILVTVITGGVIYIMWRFKPRNRKG
jgi:hypothetical protein